MIIMEKLDGYQMRIGTIQELQQDVHNINFTMISFLLLTVTRHFLLNHCPLVRQWTYLQCTQLGQFRTITSSGSFGHRLNEAFYFKLCRDAFGSE